ncbi:MAG: hypothetical protein Q7K42_02775 [Candidatus Diapherotrites archaeon]|nr:hypothetical protein [Candidatus Diapherotrites archaeon]
MNVSLNFGKNQVKEVRKFLEQFPALEIKTDFEEFRAQIADCTVTLYNSGKLSIQGTEVNQAKELILAAVQGPNELVFGIDETGRSEIEGPFVIAGVLGSSNNLRELRDSKKTSRIHEKFDVVTEKSLAQISLSLNAEFVDKLREQGLTLNEIEKIAVNKFTELFEELGVKAKFIVDGSPIQDAKKEIEFLVKGDDLEPVVGAASIVAKHLRDISKDKKKRETWNVKKEK